MSTNQMQPNRKSTLEQVKNTIIRELSGRSAKAYLFGSWARSEEKRSSDIDIAIDFDTKEDTNCITLMRIRDALEESTIPYRIDVVDFQRADERIIQKIKEEGILWDVRVND